MGTVKTGVVVAGDQHLVPVGKVADPLKEIKRLYLGARYREVPAVHEDICLRKVPQATVYPVGIGQMNDFQFHGAKLVISEILMNISKVSSPYSLGFTGQRK